MNVIEVDGLSKSFGTRKALDRITFDLPEGAALTIFGPNGAGKTTLLRILATLARPSGGQVRICGVDVRKDPDKARAHMGIVSHEPMLYPDLTAEENLVFYARLYGMDDPQNRARDLLAKVGISHRRLDAVRSYSRGMMQRAAIARALIHDPDVVLLDEPFSGLDQHAADILADLIGEALGKRTQVMVSHDLQSGLSTCTHAMVIARGRIVAFERREGLDGASFADRYRNAVGQGVA